MDAQFTLRASTLSRSGHGLNSIEHLAALTSPVSIPANLAPSMPMQFKFAIGLALVAFPLVEIALLIRAGVAFGFWPVAAVVVLTGAMGLAIIRRQGLAMITRMLSESHPRRGLAAPILDGLLVATAGVLLIMPGLMSDCVGLALLVPAVRQWAIRAGLAKLISKGFSDGDVSEGRFRKTAAEAPHRGPETGPIVIEGEFERIEEKDVDPKETPRSRRA